MTPTAAAVFRRPDRRRWTGGPLRRLPAAWTLTTAAAVAAAGRGPGVLAGLIAALRQRLTRLRGAGDSGLTTVEVAIITAVLLGLATALVAAITIVVHRNTSRIH